MSTLHTPGDLAAKFGGDVTARKVLDWAREHDWPRINIGRTVRFTDEQVEAILAKHTVTAKRDVTPAAFVIEGQTKRSARRSA